MNTKLSFTEAWQYPSKIEREIKGCEYSDTKITPRKFNSGRDIYKTTFYNVCNEPIESRTAMRLMSKRTDSPYFVCETNEAIARKPVYQTPRVRQPTVQPASGADVVEELMTGLYDD